MSVPFKITEGKTVQAKTLTISAKCSDLCITHILNERDEVVFEHDGYVPDFMPEQHFGDRVMLDIDIGTGQITNWKIPSPEAIEAWVRKVRQKGGNGMSTGDQK